ncbi:MAG: GTPase Era [Caldisericaceae bacterium]
MKSGFVTIVGRPNVGKSTLVNSIVGSKISIATPKPQTTRFNILGVYNATDAQIVFVDTPGYHIAKSALNQYMVRLALKSIEGTDLVYLLVEVNDFVGEEYSDLYKTISREKVPVFLVINKTDKYNQQEIEQTKKTFTKDFTFDRIIEISALTGKNVSLLIDDTISFLSEGPEYFPPGQKTNISLELQLAEIVREYIMIFLGKELPYSTAVNIEQLAERENGKLFVDAVIYVSREPQKAIVIGHSGKMIKKIGSFARFEMEQTFKREVYLQLTVKVEENWPKLESKLKKLGYIIP